MSGRASSSRVNRGRRQAARGRGLVSGVPEEEVEMNEQIREEILEENRRERERELAWLKEKIGSKRVARERHIEFPSQYSARFKRYKDVIEALGWIKFVQRMDEPCYDFVLEFYLNIANDTSSSSMVGGRRIDFSAGTIRRFYNLPVVSEEEDMIAQLGKDECPVSRNEVINTLTLGGPPEFLSTNAGSLPLTSMCKEAQFWRRFIAGKVLGVKNESDSSKEAQNILYAICTQKRFDVSKIIHDNLRVIKRKVASRKLESVSLAFPSLITGLCKAAGVAIPDGGIILDKMKACGANFAGVKPNPDPIIYEWHRINYGNRRSAGFESPVFAWQTETDAQPQGSHNRESGENRAGNEAGPSSYNADQFFEQRLQGLESRVSEVYDLVIDMRNQQEMDLRDYRQAQRALREHLSENGPARRHYQRRNQQNPQDGGE